MAEVHRRGKRLMIAGTTPALQHLPQEEVWRRCASAGADAILTDWPLELPKGPLPNEPSTARALALAKELAAKHATAE